MLAPGGRPRFRFGRNSFPSFPPLSPSSFFSLSLFLFPSPLDDEWTLRPFHRIWIQDPFIHRSIFIQNWSYSFLSKFLIGHRRYFFCPLISMVFYQHGKNCSETRHRYTGRKFVGGHEWRVGHLFIEYNTSRGQFWSLHHASVHALFTWQLICRGVLGVMATECRAKLIKVGKR